MKTLAQRKAGHAYQVRKKDRRGAFQVALLEHGFSTFQWEQIDTAESKEELDSKEKHWIAHYQSNNQTHGYNITEGGIVFSLTIETRHKMSEAHKGEKIFWHGKRFSEDHRRKIGEAGKGRKHSAESKQKISKAKIGKPSGMKGKSQSPETRKKISEARKKHG